MSNKKLGVTRSLTYKYTQIKQSINEKKNSLNDSAGLMTEKNNTKFLNDSNGDFASWNLSPKYIEKFNMCNDILQDLEIKFGKLQEVEQKRLMPKFDDAENKQLNKSIRNLIAEMTSKIKQCESNVKDIFTEHNDMNGNPIGDNQIKSNMKHSLLTKVGEFTKKFKLNEEQYMKKYQDIIGDDYTIPLTEDSRIHDKESEKDKKDNFLLVENGDKSLMKRDSELTSLLSSINELAQIFKDLQILVMEQGTILDRIDYNIESAVASTTDAHKHLVKAEKELKKNCARNAILVMIVIIFILAVLLIFKFV